MIHRKLCFSWDGVADFFFSLCHDFVFADPKNCSKIFFITCNTLFIYILKQAAFLITYIIYMFFS